MGGLNKVNLFPGVCRSQRWLRLVRSKYSNSTGDQILNADKFHLFIPRKVSRRRSAEHTSAELAAPAKASYTHQRPAGGSVTRGGGRRDENELSFREGGGPTRKHWRSCWTVPGARRRNACADAADRRPASFCTNKVYSPLQSVLLHTLISDSPWSCRHTSYAYTGRAIACWI
ncbi:hypothetical protein EVAR_27714_1 [Eumeta japonica]|uniref:Uncharacterized protein n=1 Tax=Eumeta variegata TaxID=151549 RepID=A0A4C1WNC0_EUMVA|nr:hypothetical protein EVAR_27714_1 [Eumeta japonica]